MENNTDFQKYIYLWVVLSLSVVFFLYSHLLQMFPQDAARWLMDPLHMDLDQFNPRAAPFFYSFLIIQIFLAGILLDKLGIRLLMVLAAGLCLFGAYFCAYINADSLISLLFSRILIGAGIAFVTVGYSKVVAGLLPANRYALMGGIFATAALLGSIFGDMPTIDDWLHYTWQQMVIFTAAGALILAGLLSLILRDHNQLPELSTWKDIRLALQNSQNWLLTGYSGLAFAPILILGGVAGKPFFEEAYAYTHQQIIELGGFLLVGLATGGPLIGYWSGRLKRRRALMLMGILVQEFTFIPLIYLNQTPFWLNAILLSVFGVASSAFILSFAIGREINKITVAGTIAALINIGIIAITALTDQLFGKLLISDWDGKIVNGLRYFCHFDYQMAFAIFPVYLLLGFVLLLFVEEPLFW